MYLLPALIGFVAGVMGGMFGVGGGLIMIPALIYFMKYSQHMAQGTSLAAMIPPIGILAAYEYYRSGNVNIPVALIIAAGFIFGGFLGAKLAVPIDDALLKKIFGVLLLLVSLDMIFRK